MTQAFLKAIQSAMPDFKISDKPLPEPPPEGYMAVTFHVKRTSSAARMTIRLGDDPPRHLTFSSEEEAAAFIGKLFAVVKS